MDDTSVLKTDGEKSKVKKVKLGYIIVRSKA